MRYILLILIFSVSTTLVSAQKLQERGEVRRGNKEFVAESYDKALEHYTRAVEYAPQSFESKYNLGSAILKGGDLEGGEKLLAEIAADSLLSGVDRSNAYFNLGNSQFEQQKLQEALESYKSAIRLDPTDQEAKYNYAYTKALLQQQQDQDQDQNEEQNDEQQDQDQNNQNQDQNDQDQDQDQQEQPQDQNEDQQDQQDQPQPQDPQTQQAQQQMLDAIQAQEDKTQEDLKERAVGVVVPGAKNW